MASKIKPNGFYMFMKQRQKIIKKETGVSHSMRELPAICRGSWNSMSQEERAEYDKQAKILKRDLAFEPCARGGRKDNQRQYISQRIDPVKESERRRCAEKQKMRLAWGGQDLKELKFYVINFQVMYIDENADHRMPLEVGMICITMNSGIMKDMHRFINSGDPPEGFRGLSMSHSEATHQIPFNFEHGDDNFKGLWKQIEEFVCDDLDSEVPPVFCLSTERNDVEACLEFIHMGAGVLGPNRLHRVYCLEDLASSLIVLSKKNSMEPSNTQIRDTLQQNRWDYRSDIRCHFHEEVDCAHCSMSIVKRYSFALFDILSGVMNFKLTHHHLPDDKEVNNNVFYPPVVEKAWDKDALPKVTQNLSRLSVAQQPKKPVMFVEKKIPIISRLEIHLSESSDSDDDEVLYTEEVKSTVDQYKLKELRLPRTVSMAAEVPTIEKISNNVSYLPMGRGSSVAAPRRPGQLTSLHSSPSLSNGPVASSLGRGVLIGRGRASPSISDAPGPARLIPVGHGVFGCGMSLGRGSQLNVSNRTQ